MAEIGRLITAMVTPFDENGAVDYDQAKSLAKALVASGSDGVIVSGTTGESPTLSTEEKLRLGSSIHARGGAAHLQLAGIAKVRLENGGALRIGDQPHRHELAGGIISVEATTAITVKGGKRPA